MLFSLLFGVFLDHILSAFAYGSGKFLSQLNNSNFQEDEIEYACSTEEEKKKKKKTT